MKTWYVNLKHKVAMDSPPVNMDGWTVVELPIKATYTIKGKGGKEYPPYRVALAIVAGQITIADIN